MRFTIDTAVLEKDGFTTEEFAVLLYYIGGGKGVLNKELCDILWNKGFLIKDVEGFIIDNNKYSVIEGWVAASSITPDSKDRLMVLADTLRSLYPTGKKMGTNDYWRDSTKVIAQRLAIFFKKYGDRSDESVIKATRAYVESFNGEYQYMRLLKYFIYKKEGGDEVSPLASCLDNAGQEDTENLNWRDSVR